MKKERQERKEKKRKCKSVAKVRLIKDLHRPSSAIIINQKHQHRHGTRYTVQYFAPKVSVLAPCQPQFFFCCFQFTLRQQNIRAYSIYFLLIQSKPNQGQPPSCDFCCRITLTHHNTTHKEQPPSTVTKGRATMEKGEREQCAKEPSAIIPYNYIVSISTERPFATKKETLTRIASTCPRLFDGYLQSSFILLPSGSSLIFNSNYAHGHSIATISSSSSPLQ